jgi:Bifunctional DNA primase/polymerase, N-terminal
MTIPSLPHVVQGLGATSEVLRGTSPAERTATAPDRLPCTSSSRIYATALAYLAAGRSVVPIAPGCEAPSIVDPRTGRSTPIRWERYQEEPATPGEVQRWFAGPQPMGIGIVAGPVSGVTLADGTRAALECLDFDDADVHARFVAPLTARGVLFLLEPTFESPMTEPMIFHSRGSVSRCYPLALGAPYCGWTRWRGGADAAPNLPNP